MARLGISRFKPRVLRGTRPAHRLTPKSGAPMESEVLKSPVRLALFAIAATAVCAQGFAGDRHTTQQATGRTADEAALPDTTPAAEDTEIVRAARLDLAGRLDISVDEIAVVSVTEVTWRDGSIGCPRPDMAYKQVLVNGSRIVLRARGTDYHYHVGGGRGPFYCAEPAEPLPADTR
jgi:hypothetical protein